MRSTQPSQTGKSSSIKEIPSQSKPSKRRQQALEDEALPELQCLFAFEVPNKVWKSDEINAMNQVCAIVDQVLRSPLNDSVNELNGLYVLLRREPQFRLEAIGVGKIWEGYAILSSIQARINASVDGPRPYSGVSEKGRRIRPTRRRDEMEIARS